MLFKFYIFWALFQRKIIIIIDNIFTLAFNRSSRTNSLHIRKLNKLYLPHHSKCSSQTIFLALFSFAALATAHPTQPQDVHEQDSDLQERDGGAALENLVGRAPVSRAMQKDIPVFA